MSKLRFGLRTWSRHRVLLHRTCDSKGYLTSNGSVREGIRGHVQRLVEKHQQIEHKIASNSELSSNELKRLYQTLSELEPVVKLVGQLEQKEQMLTELQLLLSIPELEMEARGDIDKCQVEIEQVKSALIKALLPRDTADSNSAILEVRAGAGGREASLFTADVYQMYQKYSIYKNWTFEALTISHCESGGYKNASASISGAGVFGAMKFETGVHRVQRIPVTESHGRVHTSTMTVAILPVPTEIEIEIKESDLKIDTFRSSGAGGQHVNTTDSAVRLTHIPSGIVISMQEDRSQHKNRAKALQVLRARLYEQKRSEEDEARKQQRKQQTGTGERSEKIRTYNFQQDRVTDHRIKRTVNGVVDFISGTGSLNEMIDELIAQDEALRLSNLMAL